MAAAVSLLVADFYGFIASLLLLVSAFCRCCWQRVVVGGGGVPYLGNFCRIWRLVFEVVVIVVVVVVVVLSLLLFCCC